LIEQGSNSALLGIRLWNFRFCLSWGILWQSMRLWASQ